MGIMDRHRPKTSRDGLSNPGKRVMIGKPLGLALSCSICFVYGSVQATDWRIRPYLSVQEIYSDNINLAPSGEEDDAFVTQLSPGVTVNRNGRTRLNLSYRMQNLFYAGTNSDPQINNQLQLNSQSEILDDSVYLDTSASIGQANLNSTGTFATDNISRAGNSTTFRTLRISPYWRPYFGGYAEGLVRVTYSNFSNSGGGNFDSNSLQEFAALNSGRRFSALGWRANFNNQDTWQGEETDGQGGTGNIRYQNYNGELSHRLLAYDYRVFVQAGCYDNNFQGTGNLTNAQNGCYVTPGLAWTPSPKFSLAGGYGINNRFVSLFWNPSRRTILQVAYRDSNVGGAGANVAGSGNVAGGGGGNVAGFGAAGFGQGGYSAPAGQLGGFNAGSTWNGVFQHSTRRTSWSASYLVSQTTIQQVLTNQQVFIQPTDAQGNLLDPVLNPRPIDIPNFTNDIITRKRGQVSVTGFASKTSVTLSAYQENRTYQSSINPPQDILGFTAAWNWRFTRRTNSILRATWQQTDNQASTANALAGKNDLINVSLLLNRQFSRYLNGYLEFRHQQQDSNTDQSTALNQYDENRVTAALYLSY